MGLVFGAFGKGSESYNANGTTTVVNFTLPAGVTVHSDVGSCGPLGFGGLCVVLFSNSCSTPTSVTSGGKVDFRIACDSGESFTFLAVVDSLLPNGTYDVNVEFKVATTQRVNNPTNMWQIKMEDVFQVPFSI